MFSQLIVASLATLTLANSYDCPGYTRTALSTKAISVPAKDGCSTFINHLIYEGQKTIDAARCVADCENACEDCHFVNTWLEVRDGKAINQVCAMYTSTYTADNATVNSYTRPSDHKVVTVRDSYSYSNTAAPNSEIMKCVVAGQKPYPPRADACDKPGVSGGSSSSGAQGYGQGGSSSSGGAQGGNSGAPAYNNGGSSSSGGSDAPSYGGSSGNGGSSSGGSQAPSYGSGGSSGHGSAPSYGSGGSEAPSYGSGGHGNGNGNAPGYGSGGNGGDNGKPPVYGGNGGNGGNGGKPPVYGGGDGNGGEGDPDTPETTLTVISSTTFVVPVTSSTTDSFTDGATLTVSDSTTILVTDPGFTTTLNTNTVTGVTTETVISGTTTIVSTSAVVDPTATATCVAEQTTICLPQVLDVLGNIIQADTCCPGTTCRLLTAGVGLGGIDVDLGVLRRQIDASLFRCQPDGSTTTPGLTAVTTQTVISGTTTVVFTSVTQDPAATATATCVADQTTICLPEALDALGNLLQADTCCPGTTCRLLTAGVGLGGIDVDLGVLRRQVDASLFRCQPDGSATTTPSATAVTTPTATSTCVAVQTTVCLPEVLDVLGNIIQADNCCPGTECRLLTAGVGLGGIDVDLGVLRRQVDASLLRCQPINSATTTTLPGGIQTTVGGVLTTVSGIVGTLTSIIDNLPVETTLPGGVESTLSGAIGSVTSLVGGVTSLIGGIGGGGGGVPTTTFQTITTTAPPVNANFVCANNNSPQCCTFAIAPLVGLNCSPFSGTATSVEDFQDQCTAANAEAIAQCCVVTAGILGACVVPVSA